MRKITLPLYDQAKAAFSDRCSLLFLLSYAAFALHLAFFTIRFFHALYWLDYILLPGGVAYRLVLFFVALGLWPASTMAGLFAYRRPRAAAYLLSALQITLSVCSVAYELLSRLTLPAIMALPTDAFFTEGMVLFLARLLTELPLMFLFLFLMRKLLAPLRPDSGDSFVFTFKLVHHLKAGKESNGISYPLAIARDMSTGKRIQISEEDRFLHTLVDGTSGTGKTSSTILPAVCADLDMRCVAEQKQMAAMLPLVENGQYAYTDESSFFSIRNFVQTGPDNTDMAEKLRLLYPVCGVTVMAPEDSLTDDVCRLCEARHIPYHRIDATLLENGRPKPQWTGLNPFFLSPSLSGEALHQAIVKKALIFSDILQVITDLKGKTDSYFTGLNRQMLANLSILVMCTVPSLHGRQATPADLQQLLNNFSLLPPYVKKLDELDAGNGRYSFVLRYLYDELLGAGRVKMEDQSRGTRNIVNEFLLMPGTRNIYCSQTSLDFDRILANGEVTVCNYDLASGDSNAIALGLFFLLSFNNAVLSRPGTEKSRTPHFFYIDELPVLIHASLEKNFALFRKFRVAMFCAIQTLDQFEKNELTRYLKGVVLGCAHIFVFGRSSLADMEIFSSMAGMYDAIDEQNAVSETALSDDSPALSYSLRESVSEKELLKTTAIRMKDFQEITLFTVRHGRPLPPIAAKVEFLKLSDWNPGRIQPITPRRFESESSSSADGHAQQADGVNSGKPSTEPAGQAAKEGRLLSRYRRDYAAFLRPGKPEGTGSQHAAPEGSLPQHTAAEGTHSHFAAPVGIGSQHTAPKGTMAQHIVPEETSPHLKRHDRDDCHEPYSHPGAPSAGSPQTLPSGSEPLDGLFP